MRVPLSTIVTCWARGECFIEKKKAEEREEGMVGWERSRRERQVCGRKGETHDSKKHTNNKGSHTFNGGQRT